MSKHYLEYVGGNSAKFWEIETVDNTATVRFGRICTDDQTQTKTLPSAEAATRHAEKLINQKKAKGYVETVNA